MELKTNLAINLAVEELKHNFPRTNNRHHWASYMLESKEEPLRLAPIP